TAATVIAMHLREVMILEAPVKLLEEVVDGDDRLVGQLREVEGFGGFVHDRFLDNAASGSARRTSSRRRVRPSKDLQVELFVEGGDLALSGTHEQLSGHGDEDAVVASGVIDEGLLELARHERSIAGALD